MKEGVINTGVLNVTLVERKILFILFSLSFIWRKEGGSMAHFGIGYQCPLEPWQPPKVLVWPGRQQLLSVNSL